MEQPLQVLNWSDSLDKNFNIGDYREASLNKFPVLVDLVRFIPFQLKRDIIGTDPLTWDLIDCEGNETSMILDIAKITNYEMNEGFEQLIYDIQLELNTTLTKGLYYSKITDASNTYISEWFVLDNLSYAIYGYGAYSDGFSNGFLIEDTEPLGFETNFAINSYNLKDFNDLVYQFGFQNIIAVNDLHFTELNFIDKNETSIIDKSSGKEVINNIYNLKKYKIEFYHNIKIAEFCVFLEMIDVLTITNKVQEIITPINWEIEISKTDNEFYYKIGIGFDTYYMNRNNCNQDF